jgi:hypothetical protein
LLMLSSYDYVPLTYFGQLFTQIADVF